MRQARVGIVGGTGYTGAELVRLLAGDPGAELACISSRQHRGEAVAAMFPSLRGVTDLRFGDPDTPELRDCDVVFFATPHGIAMRAAPALLEAGVRVIDLSADFRLRDAAVFERWYGMSHEAPEALAESVYGLSELMREAIAGARLVANPGCYPTAVQLGFAPLLAEGLLVPESMVADVKSGVTGAGREAKTGNLFSENHDSFRAYGVGGHRHGVEVNQELSRIAGASVDCIFTPHLLPIQRGIHATLHARMLEARDLQPLYEAFYRDEPFVDVLPVGVLPGTRNVRGSNRCQIAVVPQSAHRVVICSVIDNLVKGASGQAVQNMNLMLGLDETLGLALPPLWP